MSKIGKSLLKGAKEALAYAKKINRPKVAKTTTHKDKSKTLGKDLINALKEAKMKGLVTLKTSLPGKKSRKKTSTTKLKLIEK